MEDEKQEEELEEALEAEEAAEGQEEAQEAAAAGEKKGGVMPDWLKKLRVKEYDAAKDAKESPASEEPAADSEAGETSGEAEQLQQALKEKEDQYLRLQAEYANFRRRTTKEKEELAAVVTQNILTDMLPLLDNFDRAMVAESADLDAFKKGIEMIYGQFQDVLKKNGLELIQTEGATFDPNFHQAVMRVENPEMEDDQIAQELQKGYIVKGRVIRPSMVQVVANS
ncbi:MAG: nucleotide exchange factor GrpE [Selenomonadaceae bacterium]|nr:nucleotide exchange factor GrpE [Selenomonadaceae bacterium]